MYVQAKTPIDEIMTLVERVNVYEIFERVIRMEDNG